MTTRKYNAEATRSAVDSVAQIAAAQHAEALEAPGQRMFPTAYTPIESQWALVHSSH